LTIEGVWLNMMTMNTGYDRAAAQATVLACAAAFFLRHFNAEGRLAR